MFVEIEQSVQCFLLGLARLSVAFMVLPILSKKVLGGTLIRNGCLLSFALFIYPINAASLAVELNWWQLLSILTKEAILGLILGYIAALPFWVAEGVGFFIDNQRGAAMASTVNPLLGEQSSPLGILMTQIMVMIFVTSGALSLLIFTLAQSYILWPVGELWPSIFVDLDVFILGQLDHLMRSVIVLSAPVVLAMFLSEFALALISRFAPQLNVFFLAMPVKSAVAFLVLLLYLTFAVEHLQQLLVAMPQGMIDFILERRN